MRFLLSLLCFVLTGMVSFSQGSCRIVVTPHDYEGKREQWLQTIIDSAAKRGDCIAMCAGVYPFSQTLRIPAGVTIHGAGAGSTTLIRPAGGTVLRYMGKQNAIAIEGSNAALYDMSLESGGDTCSGISIIADSSLVESVVLSRVNLYGFTRGTALSLHALRHGGLGYCSFYDLRIRHAKTGIHIWEEGAGSFVNSNSFFHGAVSGGGFDICLLVDGGDNNIFYSTVIEPYESGHAHVLVRKGSITGEHIRIEATRQDPQKPVLYFAAGTHSSELSGFFSGGRVQDLGDNHIRFGAPNFIGEEASGKNELINAWFTQSSDHQLPAGWVADKDLAKLRIDAAGPVAGANTLWINLAPHSKLQLFPGPAFAPMPSARANNDHAGFSALVHTNRPNSVKLTYNFAGGTVSSVAHSGSGQWETLGMQVIVNRNAIQRPALHIDNSNNDDSLLVGFTAPSFAFGLNPPLREPQQLNSNGGRITGTVTMGVSRSFRYDESSKELILPLEANLFIVQQRGLNVTGINRHQPFPAGTVITLLFEQPWTKVKKCKDLLLKTDFVSSQAHCSLSLLSNGDGSWTETGRNN